MKKKYLTSAQLKALAADKKTLKLVERFVYKYLCLHPGFMTKWF